MALSPKAGHRLVCEFQQVLGGVAELGRHLLGEDHGQAEALGGLQGEGTAPVHALAVGDRREERRLQVDAQQQGRGGLRHEVKYRSRAFTCTIRFSGKM
jgi:hypothetical protein